MGGDKNIELPSGSLATEKRDPFSAATAQQKIRTRVEPVTRGEPAPELKL